MKYNVLGVGLILFCSGAVFAQQALVGKYSGSFIQPTNRGDINQGLTLEITSMDGETVKGKAVRNARQQGRCNGEYPVEGTVKGNELHLMSTEKGGRGEDCDVNLKLTVEGKKLVGTMGQFKAELSK